MNSPHDHFWGSYAIGILHDVQVGEQIVEYVRGIDSSLQPFGGRFLVHGGTPTQVEGAPLGDVVVIAFPHVDGARDWYASDGYRAIVGLRTGNSRSQVVLVRGVDSRHRGEDVLANSSAPLRDGQDVPVGAGTPNRPSRGFRDLPSPVSGAPRSTGSSSSSEWSALTGGESATWVHLRLAAGRARAGPPATRVDRRRRRAGWCR